MSAIEFSDVHRLSVEEFQHMVDSGALEDMRVELIDGLLVDMSPPSPEHDASIIYFNTLLVRALDPGRYVVRPQMGLSIGNSAPQPDLSIVTQHVSRPYYPATAEVAIEVSRSSLRRDLMVKSRIYASAEVKEYWVIDADNGRALVHRDPGEGGYRMVDELFAGDHIDASIVGIDPIPVADILAAAQRPA